MLKFILTLALCLATVSLPARASGGGLGGGATEATQLANNAELVASYAKHAESVMVQINQYMTMLQNLQQLPAAALRDALGTGVGELAGQMQQYLSLYQSVDRLRRSAQATSRMLDFHGNALGSLNMSGEDYLNAMLALSRSGHEYYRGMHQDALSTLQSLERDGADVQRLADSIPGVTGNIQGLQLIAAGQAQVARQLVGLQSTLAQANASTALEGEEARKREEISKARMKAWASEIQGMPRMSGGR